MDIIDVILLLGFTLIIIKYSIDIKELIIPTKKRKTKIIGLSIGFLIILWIMYKYAGSILNYIMGILGIVIFTLSVLRLGITSKGFNPNRGVTWKWDKISSVHIIIKKDLIIEFYRKYTSDIHIYKKEDYDRIIEMLRENLSSEKIKVQHK